MLTRTLIYGPAAGGKSYFGNSSWWDSKKREKVEGRDGLWITFGAEDNPTLHIPEENRKRFTSAGLDDLRWLQDFHKLAKGLVAAYKQNSKPAVYSIVIDGFSEFDLLYQQVLQTVDEAEISKNQFHVWKNMMAQFFTILQLLHPINTGAHLIATARRGEVKKYVQRQVGSGQDKAQWQVEESDWFDGAEASPSLHGGFRRDIPHYFDYVLYTETDTKIATEGPRKGQKVPVHRLYTMKGGDVYIKNNSEEQWLDSDYPLVLENATFPKFLEIVEKLNE